MQPARLVGWRWSVANAISSQFADWHAWSVSSRIANSLPGSYKPHDIIHSNCLLPHAKPIASIPPIGIIYDDGATWLFFLNNAVCSRQNMKIMLAWYKRLEESAIKNQHYLSTMLLSAVAISAQQSACCFCSLCFWHVNVSFAKFSEFRGRNNLWQYFGVCPSFHHRNWIQISIASEMMDSDCQKYWTTFQQQIVFTENVNSWRVKWDASQNNNFVLRSI